MKQWCVYVYGIQNVNSDMLQFSCLLTDCKKKVGTAVKMIYCAQDLGTILKAKVTKIIQSLQCPAIYGKQIVPDYFVICSRLYFEINIYKC